MSLHDPIATGSRITRAMSVQSAIHWAFVNEKVRLDFDRYGAHEFDREGIDPIWRGMRIAELGTVVDGGEGARPATPHSTPASSRIASRACPSARSTRMAWTMTATA